MDTLISYIRIFKMSNKFNNIPSAMDWIVAPTPKCTHWSPNLRHGYLEIRPLDKVSKVK